MIYLLSKFAVDRPRSSPFDRQLANTLPGLLGMIFMSFQCHFTLKMTPNIWTDIPCYILSDIKVSRDICNDIANNSLNDVSNKVYGDYRGVNLYWHFQ